MPEGGIYGLVGEGEHAHGNGAYLPVADGYEVTCGSHYEYKVALLDIAVDALYRAREHPWMEAAQRVLLAALEVDGR